MTPLTKEELYEYIRVKQFNYNENEIKSAIAFSGGIPGKIDRYFNDDTLKDLRSKILYLIKDLNKNDVEVILQYEEKLIGLKDNKEEVLNILGGFIRDILIYKEVENKDFIINGDKIIQQLKARY